MMWQTHTQTDTAFYSLGWWLKKKTYVLAWVTTLVFFLSKTKYVCMKILFRPMQWSLPEYLHNYILRKKIKAVLTLDTDTPLTWVPCMSSPGCTSHQSRLHWPPRHRVWPCPGNMCQRASVGGPGISRPHTHPRCHSRICWRSLIRHPSLPDFLTAKKQL